MLATNQILQGDCVTILKTLPDKSIDVIFADPPYFMQTTGDLLRTNGDKFSGIDDDWDKFDSLCHYDDFCKAWLTECRRVLKDNGSIWVIGSFQNIYRLGYILQDLGFWILNDVIWHKTNPVPNFAGSRLCNAHETLLWCAKGKNNKFTFNYKTMKAMNGAKQEKSVWTIPLCTGNERIKNNDGKKAHATQKPELLIEKVILSSTKVGDVILDPFFGTGTTGAVAKRLKRNYIGIEREPKYIEVASNRIESVMVVDNDYVNRTLETKPPKVSMQQLLSLGLIKTNQVLYDKDKKPIASITNSGMVYDGLDTLSIHKLSAKHLGKLNYNGWDFFYIYHNEDFLPLNKLRYIAWDKIKAK